MLKYSELVKNTGAYKQVLRDIQSGKLSHAYLVICEDGAVLDTLFSLISCAIYCPDGGCAVCGVCRKVLDGNNTNIYAVTPNEKGSIGTDEIRAMIDSTYYIPLENAVKLYVVKDGERMRPEAQNKLLKTLEEPVGNTVILIGASRENAILDTIKSRCKKVYVGAFSREEIQEELSSKFDGRDIDKAIAVGGGLVSVTEELLRRDNIGTAYDTALSILREMTNSKKEPEAIAKLKPNRESLSEFINILEIIMKNMLLLKEGMYEDEELKALGEGYTVKAIVNIQDLINKSREKLNFNCQPQFVADYLLFGILEVKYRCR